MNIAKKNRTKPFIKAKSERLCFFRVWPRKCRITLFKKLSCDFVAFGALIGLSNVDYIIIKNADHLFNQSTYVNRSFRAS